MEVDDMYCVEVIIEKEKYYLATLSGTISKSITDSIIFANENVAFYYATKIEDIYSGSLGKVKSLTVKELF